VGICPLFVERISLWGLVVGHEIRFLGSSVSRTDSKGLFAWYSPTDYLDAIVLPGREDEVFPHLSHTLWTEISEGNRRLSLTNLAGGSVLPKHLLRHLTQFPVKVRTSIIETCPKVDLPASVEEFIGRLGSNARRRWRKIRSAVEDTETFHIRSIQTPDAFDVAFRSLRSLHQGRWQKAGFPGGFFDNRYGSFLEGVCRDLLATGNLWFQVLEYRGRIVAARLGLVFGDTMYDYLSGFDDEPSIAKFRPGLMLLYSMIKDSVAMNFRVLDLLRGDEAYKSEVSTRIEFNSEITVMRSGVPSSVKRSGLALVLALRTLRNRIENELILLRVQMKNAGFVQAFMRYAGFRIDQIASKRKRKEDSEETSTKA
jgi:CelD/BcsL family acetyltransferase involved in cellulose biosynthesis